MLDQKKFKVIRPEIFIPMCTVFLFIILMGLISPEALFNGETAISNFQYDYFGWLYALMAIANIAMLVWLACSSYGSIKLGGENAKPILSRWNWFAISLCGGIGTGIVIWSIAEPLYHLNSTVPGLNQVAGSSEAALTALSVCFLHWGIPSYAHYCIFGVAAGFAIYNMKLPYRISSILYPLFGKKALKLIGTIVDNFCLLAIAVSVSAILANAALTFGV